MYPLPTDSGAGVCCCPNPNLVDPRLIGDDVGNSVRYSGQCTHCKKRAIKSTERNGALHRQLLTVSHIPPKEDGIKVI